MPTGQAQTQQRQRGRHHALPDGQAQRVAPGQAGREQGGDGAHGQQHRHGLVELREDLTGEHQRLDCIESEQRHRLPDIGRWVGADQFLEPDLLQQAGRDALREGLREALRATISLPGILPPATHNNDVLVDGAVEVGEDGEPWATGC